MSDNPLDPVDLEALAAGPPDPPEPTHPLSPPVAIASGNIDPERLPDDDEYAWIVAACKLPYLRKDETDSIFENRCQAELQSAGYDDISVFLPKNVAAVLAHYKGHPYVFVRGSEVKVLGLSSVADTLLDWFRNLQALGWRRVGPAAVHRGVYTEASELCQAGLPMAWANATPRLIGHSKAAGITGVLTMFDEATDYLHFTVGGMRWVKRAGQFNPWRRPNWVPNWRNRVKGWRIHHVADPVASTPTVIRSCHTGQAVVVKDDKSKDFQTEKEVVYDRMQWIAKQAGEFGLDATAGSKIGAIVRLARLTKLMVFGVGAKHTLSTYEKLTTGAEREQEAM